MGAHNIGGSVVKNSPAVQETQETWVHSLGWEDPLEESMATHSSILAWGIPWTEELRSASFESTKASVSKIFKVFIFYEIRTGLILARSDLVLNKY